MEEFEKRVIKEKEELDEKIKKLTDFLDTKIFENLDEDNSLLLEYQFVTMKEYSKILEDRISYF